MELNSETIRTFRKKRTGGLRMNGLAKSTSSSFSGSTNTVMTERTFKINRLRSSITGCQRRLFSLTTPFRWLNDELFQLRCWLGMERMSCVELADRRNTLVRLNVAVFALMAVWLICITSSSTSSRSISSPESTVSHNVKHLESTVAKDASRVEVDPCMEPENPPQLYQAPFVLPEPSTANSPSQTDEARYAAPVAPTRMSP